MALLDKEQLLMRTPDPRGKSQVIKRSVKVGAHSTSVTIEAPFWNGLKGIAADQGTPVNQLIAAIDKERQQCQHRNLSSAIRLFVLAYYRGGAVTGDYLVVAR
jgi:predicted DNA-binding ribbon-helix-helix protein